jgi:low temperature requirement protein LtrA
LNREPAAGGPPGATSGAAEEDVGGAEEVRPLELFFDLVFVVTITQVASVLTASPTLLGFARTFVLLVLIWWMYEAMHG